MVVVDWRRALELAIEAEVHVILEPRPATEIARDYGLHLDTDEDSEYFGEAFYSTDLRSLTGAVLDWTEMHLVIWPRHWATIPEKSRGQGLKGRDPDSIQWSGWMRLLRDATQVNTRTEAGGGFQ